MEKVKRFLLDDSATAEATTTVIIITAVGLLLAAGVIVWYDKLEWFFNNAGGNLENYGSNFKL